MLLVILVGICLLGAVVSAMLVVYQNKQIRVIKRETKLQKVDEEKMTAQAWISL